MRAPRRTVLLALAPLAVSAGCKSTGGKAFGTLAVASAVASGYLLTTSTDRIENHQLVSHDDRRDVGAGLMFTAVLSAGAWAVSELMLRDPTFGRFGGGYAPVLTAPAIEAVEPAAPAVEPVIPVVEPAVPAIESVAPAAEPTAADEQAAGPPVGIGVQDRGVDEGDSAGRGWRFHPRDGQHWLHAPSGELVGRMDRRGGVWDRTGAYVGRVATGPSCGVACQRLQACKILLGRSPASPGSCPSRPD